MPDHSAERESARWRAIGEVVDAALDLPSDQRAAYVGSPVVDSELRADVVRFLDACERSEGFLGQVAGDFAAPLLVFRDEEQLLTRFRTAVADRYAILRTLGKGGMAVVYLARDQMVSRQVAIKVLRSELAAVLGAGRFLREIETLSRLRHPCIVPLLDAGEADGRSYYVMPYIEGDSLRERLQHEHQLSVAESIRIAIDVASALNYAHGVNVVHRDLKPENILLQSGRALVTDFGIARAISRSADSDQKGRDAGLEPRTATGFTIGTPAYMSPEQATGDRTIDGRSDVYALGCLLYEMLVGAPPFTGPTTESIVRQHLGSTPTQLTLLRGEVPPALAKVVARALAKVPADRYASMIHFGQALSDSAPKCSVRFRAASVSHRVLQRIHFLVRSFLTDDAG